MYNQTTSLAPYGESKTITAKIKNKINNMSEKQVERVQSVSMSIIGGLMSLIVLMGGGFVKYVVEKQNERIDAQDARIQAIEQKYQVMLETNTINLAAMDKNLAIIAAKLNVDLKQ